MKTRVAIGVLAVVAALAAGCRTSHDISHEVRTVSEVKPIHITIDVNIKVDKALDDFFGDIDEVAAAEPDQQEGEQKQ